MRSGRDSWCQAWKAAGLRGLLAPRHPQGGGSIPAKPRGGPCLNSVPHVLVLVPHVPSSRSIWAGVRPRPLGGSRGCRS